MRTKKIWAVFSGLGFALLATSAIESSRAKPDIVDPIIAIGSLIAAVGIGFSIYVAMILSKNRKNFRTVGIYNIIRHPMYLSGIIGELGLVIVSVRVSLISTLIESIFGIIFFFVASRTEDRYNIDKFGKKYEEYMKRVPALNLIKALSLLQNK